MNGDLETEMMDTDSSGEAFIHDKPSSTVRDFLSAARRLVDQGEPSQALQAVVMAMRTQGGDEAVLQILNRTCELYKCRIQETASMDQLASIFSECAITEAQPHGHETTSSKDLFDTKKQLQRMLMAYLFWKKAGGRKSCLMPLLTEVALSVCNVVVW